MVLIGSDSAQNPKPEILYIQEVSYDPGSKSKYRPWFSSSTRF